MKTITVSGIVAAFLFVIAPAHADTKYFFCHALDYSGEGTHVFYSDVLSADEYDYSEYSTERSFRGYVKDEHDADIGTDLFDIDCFALNDRSLIKGMRRDLISAHRDDNNPVTTVDESDWDGDY